jgi:two-component system alkaline phosphatase synthesis response regulator PhoP
MDLLIDKKDAIDLLKEMDQLGLRRDTTVVVFSSRKENYVQITALNAGADDFLIKPVNRRVFESRLNAWLRRSTAFVGPESSGNPNEVLLNQERFSMQVNGEEIILQRREFEIISLLSSRPKKVYSRDEIKESIWGKSPKIRNRTIDVHIRNLRIKVGARYIKTYKGIGYSFDPGV